MNIHILGSQFMEKLENSGYTGVRRWYKNVSTLPQLPLYYNACLIIR